MTHGDDERHTDAMPEHMPAVPSESTLFTFAEGDLAKKEAIDRSIRAHHALADLPGFSFATDATILILLHPGFELLDVVGPLHFLTATGAQVHLVSTGAADEPVTAGGGFQLVPTTTLDEAPDDPTVILVPGGDTGILLRDRAALDKLREWGAHAAFVTSVCSGSIALAAAGLLDGRRATSHWSTRHLLAGYGAIEVDERVVEDGNRLTAAGVTAGMDLAIRLLAKICGDQYARFTMLGAEYAPEPPFDAGTPERAGEQLTDLSRDFLAPLVEELRAP